MSHGVDRSRRCVFGFDWHQGNSHEQVQHQCTKRLSVQTRRSSWTGYNFSRVQISGNTLLRNVADAVDKHRRKSSSSSSDNEDVAKLDSAAMYMRRSSCPEAFHSLLAHE
eukprot:763100-Hanusia_phi.AAC.22